jgi:hypothetical protein
MSGLYTHFRRYHMRIDKPRHLLYLQRCRICKHYFIDEQEFTTRHGRQCNTHNPGKRGDAADALYRAFCEMVLLYIREQRVTSTSKCF